jgi:hypothetical protein
MENVLTIVVNSISHRQTLCRSDMDCNTGFLAVLASLHCFQGWDEANATSSRGNVGAITALVRAAELTARYRTPSYAVSQLRTT